MKSLLQITLNRLKKNHDPDVRAVIDMMENVVAERDALQFKYQSLLARYEELQNGTCGSGDNGPTRQRAEKKGQDIAHPSPRTQTYDGDCGH